MVVTAAQFVSLLAECGHAVHPTTVRRWFRLWERQGVKHIVRQPARSGGGRAGEVFAMTLDGLRAYCRGELPSPR